MPRPLREALHETFEDWKSGIPDPWQSIVKDVDLDPENVSAELRLDPWVPIFPTLLGQHRALGAPRDSDTFRAFRDMRPRDVRAVVIGQDPYPDVAKATGLSFEQGNLKDWIQDDRLVSRSLRRIIQAAAAVDSSDDDYMKGGGWNTFLDHTRSGRIRPRSPVEFFNETREQGVLWLNTTLSISLFRGEGVYDHQPGHRAYWKPAVDAVLRHLASRDRGCVFVLWGGWAKDSKHELLKWATDAGTQSSIGFAEAGHPATNRFLESNSLAEVNDELDRLGLEPVDWL